MNAPISPRSPRGPHRWLTGTLWSLSLGAVLVAAPLTAAAEPEATIEEWPVPWENTRPRDPWVHEGQVWFVGQRGHYVARFEPEAEAFTRYPLTDGAGPHTVIVDDRGAWFAANRKDYIGLLDPESGDIHRFPLPGEGRRDSHTMDFTAGGDIWFTVQGGNRIGFLDTDSGEITLHEVATPGARPYGLIVEDGEVWATLFGTHKLATIENDQVVEIPLPRGEARPRRLARTDDGRIWYVDYAGGYIGRYDPGDGSFREWRTPAAGDARPYGMAADGQGRLWFVETGVQPNRLVGFMPDSETFTHPRPIPSGGGTVRHMYYDPAENAIWFGTDTNTLGRVNLPE